MRKLDTLDSEASARRFAAALGGRGIAAEVRPEPDGSAAVWVVEEDRLVAARGELEAFRADPRSPRFDPLPAAPKPAPDRHRHIDVRRRWERPAWQRVPVTVGLIVASVLAAAWTQLGEAREATNALLIAPYEEFEVDGQTMIGWDGLQRLRDGEVWRLFSPAILHFGPFHLLFNMMWLWMLGGAIETLRGSWRLLLAVLVIAALSNLAEYWLTLGFDFSSSEGFRNETEIRPNPLFGGMSGVVSGLFGLAWMRATLLPGSGFVLQRDTVVWMLMWLLICTAGFVGPIANVAHLGGLLVGMAIGAAPRLWRRSGGVA